jgi:hypothetical protein
MRAKNVFVVILVFLLLGINSRMKGNDFLHQQDILTSATWESPIELGNYIYYHNHNVTNTDNVRNLFIHNGTAYILIDVYGMVIVNITDPVNPQYLGRYPEYSRNVYVKNDTAYLTSGNGFFIINVSIPTLPTLLGLNDTFDCSGLHIEDDLAYVGCRYYGMVIFNISDTSFPKFVGEYLNASNQDYTDIFGSDGIIYIADKQGDNLKIINCTNPYNPEVIKIYDYDTVEGRPNDVFIENDICYLSTNNGGLKIINVSNPKSATDLTTYDTGGEVVGAFVSDDVVYISDSQVGIRILNISNPSIPIVLGSYNDPTDGSYSIYYDNSILFSGWGLQGLKILDPGYDTDEDGVPDQAEIYLYHTNPNDPNSCPDLIDPVIIINSPEHQTIYTSTPHYNITIIEDNLNSSWYTLDGGATNILITELTGVLNQTIWDNALEGQLTLEFYAKDNWDNVGHQQVVIIKASREINGFNTIIFNFGILVGIIVMVRKIVKFRNRK